MSSGFGIWATHFVAMLAFSPGIASGYNIALTFVSLIAAIVLAGVGLAETWELEIIEAVLPHDTEATLATLRN